MPERLRAAHQLQRVLFASAIDPSKKFGSFEEQTFALCREFQARGGLFLPLYSQPLGSRAADEYGAAGLSAECLDLTRFRLGSLFQLARLVREHAVDVVHWNFHEPIKNGYLWGLSLLAPGVRHYFTDHISRPSKTGRAGGVWKGFLKRTLNRRYEKIFCVSDFVAECLQEGSRWENVRRWTLFVNTERFAPAADVRRALRRSHGSGGEFLALVVAHLIPEKGVDVALRAFRELDGPARLWIVGDGEDHARLQAMAHDLGLGDRARFLGMQWDVAPFMQAADCLICPSLWAEAAGFVNVEAQACGLPVVASRIGGIPEHVEDGRTGILVPPGDVPALARALRLLQAEPSMLRAYGVEARAAAVERFSIRNHIHEIIDFYTKPAGAAVHDRERRDADPAHAPA